MSGDTPPPTGIIPRFFRLIEAIKRGMMEGAGRRQMIAPLGPLGPLLGVLLNYLMDTRRRLTALHARFVAGKLPAAPRRRASARPAAGSPRTARRPPGIPRGPAFIWYGTGAYEHDLRELLDDPEMRALLAVSPQARRLLRPLWRRLTIDPLPEVLRLPPRPREPKPPRPARPKPPSTAPAARPAPPPEAPRLWEPTPCLPPWPD